MAAAQYPTFQPRRAKEGERFRDMGMSEQLDTIVRSPMDSRTPLAVSMLMGALRGRGGSGGASTAPGAPAPAGNQVTPARRPRSDGQGSNVVTERLSASSVLGVSEDERRRKARLGQGTASSFALLG